MNNFGAGSRVASLNFRYRERRFNVTSANAGSSSRSKIRWRDATSPIMRLTSILPSEWDLIQLLEGFAALDLETRLRHQREFRVELPHRIIVITAFGGLK